MQFHIPQYIDIEDKLFGPLTIWQAIYVAGGGGGIYLMYRVIPYIFISAPIMLGIAVITWALAFYPKEKLGKPFIEVLEAGFNYMVGTKLYTWKKTTKESAGGEEEQFLGSQMPRTPTVPSGKLSSASFNIDVKGPEQAEETGHESNDKISNV